MERWFKACGDRIGDYRNCDFGKHLVFEIWDTWIPTFKSPTSTEYNFGLKKSIDLGVFSEEALIHLLYGKNTMKHVQRL